MGQLSIVNKQECATNHINLESHSIKPDTCTVVRRTFKPDHTTACVPMQRCRWHVALGAYVWITHLPCMDAT
jgi:hypothetical protein